MAPRRPPSAVLGAPSGLLPSIAITPSINAQGELPCLPSVTSVLRSQLERKLRYSILAIKETREAPWYGPWTIALDLLFLDLQLPRHAFCVIVPQLPVIRRYDPTAYDDDLAAVAALNLGVETHHIVSDQVDNALHRPLGGQSYPVTPRTRSIPPSNNSGYKNEPSTPTRKVPVPQPFDSVNRSPIKIDHAPPAGRGSIRSTRVPDFSALIHLFDKSEIDKSYLLLIVENKPFSDDPESVIIQTIEQVLEQAQHAFGADQSLKVLGCMVCVGRFWTYFDVTAGMIPASPKPALAKRSLRSAKNLPHDPGFLLSDVEVDFPEPFLKPHFNSTRGYLDLYEEFAKSMLAFRHILAHLNSRIQI